MKHFSFFSIPVFFLFILVLVGCKESRSNGEAEVSVQMASEITDLSVPLTGTPGEKIRELWHRTESVINVSWRGEVSLAEFKRNHQAVHGAWLDLQTSFAFDLKYEDPARRAIQDAFSGLRGHYGGPGAPDEEYKLILGDLKTINRHRSVKDGFAHVRAKFKDIP